MKKPLRSAKAAAKRTPSRRLAKKAAAPEISAEEALHLEQISIRYAEAEKAWLRMTAPPDGDDTWTKVEEHLLVETADQDRRWKFFSK
ncbi:MAG TPA: hypothetical protein VN915_01515 [Elusimicrobiota bacterium]|nr:hypothetical protein [Elusimicrobiota bacterium]